MTYLLFSLTTAVFFGFFWFTRGSVSLSGAILSLAHGVDLTQLYSPSMLSRIRSQHQRRR